MREAVIYQSPKSRLESSPVPAADARRRAALEARGWRVVRTVDLDAPVTPARPARPLAAIVEELEARVTVLEQTLTGTVEAAPGPEPVDQVDDVEPGDAPARRKPGPKPRVKA